MDPLQLPLSLYEHELRPTLWPVILTLATFGLAALSLAAGLKSSSWRRLSFCGASLASFVTCALLGYYVLQLPVPAQHEEVDLWEVLGSALALVLAVAGSLSLKGALEELDRGEDAHRMLVIWMAPIFDQECEAPSRLEQRHMLTLLTPERGFFDWQRYRLGRALAAIAAKHGQPKWGHLIWARLAVDGIVRVQDAPSCRYGDGIGFVLAAALGKCIADPRIKKNITP